MKRKVNLPGVILLLLGVPLVTGGSVYEIYLTQGYLAWYAREQAIRYGGVALLVFIVGLLVALWFKRS